LAKHFLSLSGFQPQVTRCVPAPRFTFDRPLEVLRKRIQVLQRRTTPGQFTIALIRKVTVKQIWEYEKECCAECYATFLGNADYLPLTGNRIITFGGGLRSNDIPVDNIVDGVLGKLIVHSKVVEVTENGDVVFSVSVKDTKYSISAETYLVERMQLYSPASFEYGFGEIHGERLGKSYTCPTSDLISAPLCYTNNLEVIFDRKVMEGDRLVVDGRFLINGQSYFLRRAFFILRSKENTYIYSSNNALNSRFFMSLDTSELALGTYQLSIAAAAREGNDQLNGKLFQGHVKTPYKIVVN
jgi:hypothetical protein